VILIGYLSHSAYLTERYSIRLLFHERFLAALSCAPLPEMYWFKWRCFHKLALLFPQRCCQGHGFANVVDRGDQRTSAAGSSSFEPRCWVETDGGGNGTSEQQCRSWIQLFRFLAALLKIARGKGTFYIIPVSNLEDESCILMRNFGLYLQHYTMLQPKG